MKRFMIFVHCKNETEKAEMRNFAEKRGYESLSAYFRMLYRQDRSQHKFSS